MSVLACGLNTSSQILCDGPAIVCCPSVVSVPTCITAASIAPSHILWKTESGWEWTGHDVENFQAKQLMKPSWKVCVSESRTAAVTDDGSVVLWNKEWKTLHFQTETEHNRLTSKTNNNNGDFPVVRPESEHKENSTCEDYECLYTKTDLTRERPYKKIKLEGQARREIKLHQDPANQRPDAAGVKFTKVVVEDQTLVALDAEGVLYCGSVVMPLRARVKDVAVGKEHTVVLTQAGHVLTWGSGMRGQLGIGELCESERPVAVETLHGVNIKMVACGAWHCAALSASGDLYMWGWNESGQLGFPHNSESNHSFFNFFDHSCQCPKKKSPEKVYCPRLRETIDGKETGDEVNSGKETQDREIQKWSCKSETGEKINLKISQVERYHCTEDTEEIRDEVCVEKTQDTKPLQDRHTTEIDKRINPHRSQEMVNVQASPLLLDFWMEDVNIGDVQCGDQHTLYKLDDGSVWSAGMNRYGQLGVGHVHSVREPCEVLGQGIKAMYAGGWNSVFITTLNNPSP